MSRYACHRSPKNEAQQHFEMTNILTMSACVMSLRVEDPRSVTERGCVEDQPQQFQCVRTRQFLRSASLENLTGKTGENRY
jgi:hypothetical protein